MSDIVSSLRWDGWNNRWFHEVVMNDLPFSFSNLGVIVDPEKFDEGNTEHLMAFKYAVDYYRTLKPILEFQDEWYRTKYTYLQSRSEEIRAMLYKARIDAQEFARVLCGDDDGIADELIADIDAEIKRYDSWTPDPNPTPKRTAREGYIYLVQAQSGMYKIGRTLNIADRAKTFTIKLPFEIEFVHTFKSQDYIQAEKDLHAKFADKRKAGEWFALTDEDVAYIKSLTGSAA